jgi:hypothetical protein
MKKIIAIILTAIAILTAVSAIADEGVYNVEGVVTAWEQIGDTSLCSVTVTDSNGNLWAFYDDEGFYRVGDLVILRMMDMVGDEEDEVLDVLFIEHLDFIGTMNWLDSVYGE